MYYATYVGLDVHKSSIYAATFSPETGEVKEKVFPGDEDGLVDWLNSLDNPVRVVYESGFSGFALSRNLNNNGINCCIAAISKTTKAAGDKVKTDRRDAIFLARQLACGNIVEVSVPSVDTEGLRDLSRLRESIRDNLTAAKHKVVQMSLRYGFRWMSSNWTIAHMRWLGQITMPTESAQTAFSIYLDELVHLDGQKKKLEKTISQMCKEQPVKELSDRFQMLLGIGPITAFSLAVEIGDFTRFSSGPSFASYLGLVPSESSSGEKKYRGAITKTGNPHIRKALVEASWCILRAKSPYKRIEQQNMEPRLVEMACNINRRLIKRRLHLIRDGKRRPCVANTATARELAQAIWAIANA
jgi:transposase